MKRSALQTYLVTLLCQDRISPRAYRVLSTLTGGNRPLNARIRAGLRGGSSDADSLLLTRLNELERLMLIHGRAIKARKRAEELIQCLR